MFGWFKSTPRYRILERASGEYDLQRLEIYPGPDIPIEAYETVGRYESEDAALADIARRKQRERDGRVVREIYVR